MDWSKQFKASACQVNLKAQNKEAALTEMVETLVKAAVLPAESQEAALAALHAREALASTGVGMNVAIPHVKTTGLVKAACGLFVHKEGLDWEAVDGAPVQLFFVVLRPEGATAEHDPEEHLDMMRWIASLGRDQDFRAFALQATKKSELVQLLKEMSPSKSR